MFGLRYIKTDPTTHLIHYRNGRIVREGRGLSFFYFGPNATLVAVPLETTDSPFIFSELSSDFQELTVQGQITHRVADPKKLSSMMNFTLKDKGRGYAAEDPRKLPQRILNVAQVALRAELQKLSLRKALRSSDELADTLRGIIRSNPEIQALGIEILNLSLLAIRPNPEMARALEAEVREQLQRESDEAIYARRNAAVEQERAIKENELNTEIAVENKKRQIRETKLEADRAAQEKQYQIKQEALTQSTHLEGKRKELVELAAENAKKEADAKAYGMSAFLKPLGELDSKILQALASVGMKPEQLIALSFQALAENAGKIGQLNISPDLLRELLDNGRKVA